MSTGFSWKVAAKPGEIAEDGIVIDSTFDIPLRFRQIDRPLDDGRASLDSIRRADLLDLRLRHGGMAASRPPPGLAAFLKRRNLTV